MRDLETKPRFPTTFVEEFSEDVANIRGNVHADLGTRFMRVVVVARKWSAGEPGRGTSSDVRTELGSGFSDDGSVTPPKVVPSGSYARGRQGTQEDGGAVVSEVMVARITDGSTVTDVQAGGLMEGHLVPFGRLEEGEEAFYELSEDDRAGGSPDRPVRRYYVASPPMRDRTGMHAWSINLRAQQASGEFGQEVEP